ncbi:MAG: Ni/Fe hydrogenase subunit alpha [Candidatus Competibacterales bacterium]
MTSPTVSRTIKVEHLARVEGEGRLKLVIRDGAVTEAKLNIFEAPRFFEAFLRGRPFAEAVDITARICGICPIAYQMSATHAMERAAGVRIEGPLRDLRRLLYCGEWIASHALHVFMLHAPDFLGYDDAIEMARDHGDRVRNGLDIKKAGNSIVTLLGGREIHPINVRVGGFYKTPRKVELQGLWDGLKRALDLTLITLDWARQLPIPHYEVDYHCVALRHPTEYPFNEGQIVSSGGIDIDVAQFLDHFVEYQVPHSTALQAVLKGGAPRGEHYLVGPIARFNLNRDRLTPLAAEAAQGLGLAEGCRNPFQSILVRLIEILFALEEALALIAAYREPDSPAVAVEPRRAVGVAATEAPRGLLFHRYEIDEGGLISSAQIIPPTSQNQGAMEDDLRGVAQGYLNLPDEELQWRCEQSVRNYDPCISCATHFLRLEIDRG